MEDRETFFLDTNILVYSTFENDPYFKKAKKIRDKVISGELKGCISHQVLVELYSIITDKRRVSNPLSTREAKMIIENYLNSFNLKKLYIRNKTIRQTMELANKYKITGQKIFDVQIVATMLDNKIKKIYTNNVSDFEKFEEVKVVNPIKDSENKQ